MTEWKIEETLEELSLEDKKVFLQGLLNEEKEYRQESFKSFSLKLGLWILALGGVATTIIGMATKDTSPITAPLFMAGGSISYLTAILTRQNLDDENIITDVKDIWTSTDTIHYLKSQIKEVDKEII